MIITTFLEDHIFKSKLYFAVYFNAINLKRLLISKRLSKRRLGHITPLPSGGFRTRKGGGSDNMRFHDHYDALTNNQKKNWVRLPMHAQPLPDLGPSALYYISWSRWEKWGGSCILIRRKLLRHNRLLQVKKTTSLYLVGLSLEFPGLVFQCVFYNVFVLHLTTRTGFSSRNVERNCHHL